MRIGIMQKLPRKFAGTVFPSPVQTAAAQHTNKGPTIADLVQSDYQASRTPLFSTARNSHSFQVFDISRFSILNPMVRYPSTTAYSFNILMPVVAHNRPSNALEQLFISNFLHYYRYNAVAPN